MWDPNLNPPRIITTSNNNNAHNPWWWYSRNVLSWVLSWIPAEGNLPVDFGASYHLLTSPPFQTSRRPTTLWATRVIICVVLLRDLGFSRPFITAGNPKNQTPHELFKGRAGPVRRDRNEASLRLHISSFLRPPARPPTHPWLDGRRRNSDVSGHTQTRRESHTAKGRHATDRLTFVHNSRRHSVRPLAGRSCTSVDALLTRSAVVKGPEDVGECVRKSNWYW